jgi:hypothetical protein
LYWAITYISRPVDFQVANIARNALNDVVEKFVGDRSKQITGSRMGITFKSAKTKANEMLQDSVDCDFVELQNSLDNLQEQWKGGQGPVGVAPRLLRLF